MSNDGFYFLYTGEISANFNLSGYAQSLKIPSFGIFNSIGWGASKVYNIHFGKIFLKVSFLEAFSFLISFLIYSVVASEKWMILLFQRFEDSECL